MRFSRSLSKQKVGTCLDASSLPPDQDPETEPGLLEYLLSSNPQRAILFSLAMVVSGAVLGPFLDAYHSAFGVLRYNQPIVFPLWGTTEFPALTTAWWVPELFGLAGFLIGWLYIGLDYALDTQPQEKKEPTVPVILIGISYFTLQYWLSGILYSAGIDRTSLLNLMSVLAAVGFASLDLTLAGFITSAATALGGPLIEAGILTLSAPGGILEQAGYRYTDLGETGFFPLWIVPVYFLGGPANGNLARGFWNALSSQSSPVTSELTSEEALAPLPTEQQRPCLECNDTRCIPCPNCDGLGQYQVMGGSIVTCTSCRGRGFVICRACFSKYGEDPWDIDAIREKMSRMPD